MLTEPQYGIGGDDVARTITHGRQAAERLARRWFSAAGVPLHVVGFSENAGFYIVVHVMARGRIHDHRVPCWGARALRKEVDAAIRNWSA